MGLAIPPIIEGMAGRSRERNVKMVVPCLRFACPESKKQIGSRLRLPASFRQPQGRSDPNEPGPGQVRCDEGYE